MAIYKPTYCYPYGGNVDFCVDPDTKAIYLQCKINTNNKKVTGYRLNLVDGNGNEIWAPKYIAPLSGIASIDYGDRAASDHGDGYNGSVVVIPFIQNFITTITADNKNFSPSCLYAKINYSVDYYVTTNSLDITVIENLAEVQDWNNNFTDSRKLPIGAKLLLHRTNGAPYYQIYTVTSSGLTSTGIVSATSGLDLNVYVNYGVDNHNTVWHVTGSGSAQTPTAVNNWLYYVDTLESSVLKLKSLPVLIGNEYSWRITLYQGDPLEVSDSDYTSYKLDEGATVSLTGSLIVTSYSESFNINQYDILIAKGQILGSTGERLQIYPTDAVLQKKWVQLGYVTQRASDEVITNWVPYGTRSMIEIYDSTYGHIYPVKGDFAEDIIEENPDKINACLVYKYSNDPNNNKESDMVRAATPINMTESQIFDIIYHMFTGGLMTIDDVALKEGDLVLLKDLTGYEYLHGVYSVGSTSWTRSGSYNQWASFLGKVLLVKEGTQNSYHNFESRAQVGKSIGTITGSTVQAVRPLGGQAIICQYETEDEPDTFAQFYYNGSAWVRYASPQSDFSTIVAPFRNDYVFIASSEPSSSANPSILTRYYVPEGATSLADCQRGVNITVSNILWINNLTGGPGFLSFTSNNNNYTWYINGLNNEQKGDNLIFVPEQSVILYPKYETLPAIPKIITLDYAAIDGQTNNDNVLQYNIKSITGNIAVTEGNLEANLIVPRFSIDGILLSNSSDHPKFLGEYIYSTDANYNTTTTVEYVTTPQAGAGSSIFVYKLKKESGADNYSIDNTQYMRASVLNTTVSTLEYDNITSLGWGIATYSARYVGSTPYLTRSFEGFLNLGTKIYIESSFYNEQVVYTSQYGDDGLYDPVELNIPEYYLGEFIVNDISTTNNTYTLQFSAWNEQGVININANVANTAVKILNGNICGGLSMITIGTYRTPILQYGLTQRIAMLNINTDESIYIKPSLNIEPNQYIVFTEVDKQQRRIQSLDDTLYKVDLYSENKPHTVGQLTLGQSFIKSESVKYILSEINLTANPNYCRWVGADFDGLAVGDGYTVINYQIGNAIYNNPSLSEGPGSAGVVGVIFYAGEIYSSVTNINAYTPYKYDILSYFKSSDYNPITYAGKADTGFAYIYSGNYAYDTMSTLTSPEAKNFIIDNVIYSCLVEQQIGFKAYNHGWKIRGYYKQSSGKRWEYYRMCIFNSDGELLQDTDKIYEGDFTQTFWGLSPNNNEATTYYCVLIVEDELGEIYSNAIKLLGAAQSTYFPFSETSSFTYNYNLQCVDINFAGLPSGISQFILLRQEENTSKLEMVDLINKGTSTSYSLRDYGVTNRRTYHYYVVAADEGNTSNNKGRLTYGGTVTTPGKCWSIAELLPVDLPSDMGISPTLKKKYYIDENNVWLFKYNGEFGSQTQNMSKAEQSTLGQFPRIGHGKLNNNAGSVSALLGSEIIAGTLNEQLNNEYYPGGIAKLSGYQERLRSARYNTSGTRSYISSNDAIDMLRAWRLFAQSKNPKLLKDVKGQSWIVQVMSNQNTPMSHVQGQPDSISFSWTQIGDVKDITIIGNTEIVLASDYNTN